MIPVYNTIVQRAPIPLSAQLTPIRIVLVDAETLFREGLRLIIESQPGMVVIGEAGALAQAIEIATRTQPDIILLELNLGNTGTALIPQLIDAAKNTRLVLVTHIQDPHIHLQAIQLGVVGVVSKTESALVLRKAIEKIYAGQVWIDHATTAHVIAQISNPHLNHSRQDQDTVKILLLSPRERDVIRLLGQGLKNKEIATSLAISETTVRHHLTSIFSKLELTDRLELIIYAYRHRLAELPE